MNTSFLFHLMQLNCKEVYVLITYYIKLLLKAIFYVSLLVCNERFGTCFSRLVSLPILGMGFLHGNKRYAQALVIKDRLKFKL